MAKKKEDSIQYLQMPLPKGGNAYKMSKISWSGLNLRQEIDSGELSMEKNISTMEAPYLTPSPVISRDVIKQYQNPLGMYGFDYFLVVLYRDGTDVYLDYIKSDGTIYKGLVSSGGDPTSIRSVVQFNRYDIPTNPLEGTFIKRLLVFPDCVSMAMIIKETNGKPVDVEVDCMFYNSEDNFFYQYVYHTPVEIDDLSERTDTSKVYKYTNDGETKYYQYIDDEWVETPNEWVWTRLGNTAGQFSLDNMAVVVKTYNNEQNEPPPESADTNYYYKNMHNNDVWRYCEAEGEDGRITYEWKVSMPPTMPRLKWATVHQSRLFGVDDTRVYASGFNDYANWNLDTVGEYNESGAWCSPSQANVKAGGNFTGITTFDGHVVAFKEDFMHEVYNNKNPFRLQDIYAEGAIDGRTICDVDGSLFFCSRDHVKVYTGGNPRLMDYKLGISGYTDAVAGTDGRNYYLYTKVNGKKRLFVFDTFVGEWSEREPERQIYAFAQNKNGMFALTKNGVYQLDTNSFDQDWSFETDLLTRQSSSGISVNIKHVKKVQMLADIGDDANVKLYLLYDDEEFDEDDSNLVYDSDGRDGRVPIRVKPRQTAHYGMKLHVEGHGYAKIYGLELLLEPGGEMFV